MACMAQLFLKLMYIYSNYIKQILDRFYIRNAAEFNILNSTIIKLNLTEKFKSLYLVYDSLTT